MSTKRIKTPYPLLSILAAFSLLSYFYLQAKPELIQFYRIPAAIFENPIAEILLGVFSLIVMLELRNVQIQRRHQQELVQRVEGQVEELLENKKKLHANAHVYANHAEKLKLFISDRLLEYIEYDEKFLHFKSIASEVRHNGVISYDKISTLLRQQLETVGVTDPEEMQRLQEASDSLRYLWDLLDLSTADNIALHIANQVCENEEVIFQSELENHPQGIPEKPLFEAQNALIKALTRCFGSAPTWTCDKQLTIDEQDWVWIQVDPTDSLLGNENHIVLALENLIGNAQFFSGRVKSRKTERHPRIVIKLDEYQSYIRYQIYNRGPHIDEETESKLFQLGYSTRRVKEHHGKGLGLYFVNEIVKGYDGKIAHSNIHNRSEVISLRIETDDGEVITEVIELVTDVATVLCRKAGQGDAMSQLDWQFSGDLHSIEITHQSDQKTHRHLSEQLKQNRLYDPSQSSLPRWLLEIDNKRKRSTTLCFKPLDISGVAFTIKLPSLSARLEGDLLNVNQDDMEQQVEKIARRFTGFAE